MLRRCYDWAATGRVAYLSIGLKLRSWHFLPDRYSMFSAYERLLAGLQRMRGFTVTNGTIEIYDESDARFNPASLSTSMLWEAYKRLFGHNLKIKKSALETYILDRVQHLKDDVLEQLEKFVFKTRFGRAVRLENELSHVDALSDAIVASSSKYDFSGNYLVYHGSYRTKDCFAIRR